MAISTLSFNGFDYDDQISAGSSSASASLDMQHSMVGETLSVDTLTIPVLIDDLPVRFYAADQGDAGLFTTSDNRIYCASDDVPVPQYIANAPGIYYFNDVLVGQYYMNERHQVGPSKYQMIFYSTMKLLDSNHFGGLYTGQTAGTIAADIMGGITYTMGSDIAAVMVYGYLPYDKRRTNLQCLLMAIGGAVRNASDGTIILSTLSSTITGTFDASRVFVGGSATDQTLTTAVQVTEHSYTPTTDSETLYQDTTESIETVTFSEPIHTLSITNGTIISSGVNYCTFQGAGYVTLTGEKYDHVTRVVTVGVTPTGIDSDVVKTITDNTLISANNAVSVAGRLFDYLTVPQIIKQDVVFGTERPGDAVNVIHPYTKQIVSACISEMDIVMGLTELRATCTFLVGYIPTGIISGFTNYVILTGTGTWSIPAGVTNIRAIIIGEGSGGDGGDIGAAGTSTGGVGGNGGNGGSDGLILEINLAVTAGDSMSYSCGNGAAGGAHDSNGTAGGPTLLNSYSSATGREYPSGYAEPKSGLTFGIPGTTGISGGTGSDPSNSSGVSYSPGTNVTYNGVTNTPGTNGISYWNDNSFESYGGGGGGPAVSANGGNGHDATWGNSGESGAGGAGASATIPGTNSNNYGQGGNGGHGGGGGGGSAYANYFGEYSGGAGGAGSSGGKGGPGAIVIYY